MSRNSYDLIVLESVQRGVGGCNRISSGSCEVLIYSVCVLYKRSTYGSRTLTHSFWHSPREVWPAHMKSRPGLVFAVPSAALLDRGLIDKNSWNPTKHPRYVLDMRAVVVRDANWKFWKFMREAGLRWN